MILKSSIITTINIVIFRSALMKYGVLKLAYGIEYSRQFYWNILSKVFSLSTVLDFGHYLCSSDSVCCRSCVALLLFIFCNKSKPSALSLSLFKQLTGYLDVSQFLYFPPHHPLFSTVMYSLRR